MSSSDEHIYTIKCHGCGGLGFVSVVYVMHYPACKVPDGWYQFTKHTQIGLYACSIACLEPAMERLAEGVIP